MLKRTTKKTIPSLYRIAFCPLNTIRFYSSSSDYSSGSASNESSQTQSYGSSSNSAQDDGSEHQGRTQRKQRDYSSTLYVKLPVGASREKLTEVLNQSGITGVVNVQIPRDVLTDTPKAFAFIEFESADAATKAINTPVSLDGQLLKLTNSRSKEESRRYRVYIGDLAYTTKEQDLTSALETQFGPVEYARITSHNGASRGYGFATFKTIEAADAARAAGSFSLDDRVVRVESVRDMETRRPGGRFGDDRRGGFGDSRSGGYGERSERSYGGGGYGRRGGSSEGGYGGGREGGYGGSRDGGYGGGNRDGGYGGGRRGGYDSGKESDSEGGYGSGGRRGGGYGGRGGSSDNLY